MGHSKPNPTALFKNCYRLQSARLQNRNYSDPGWYFITICTFKRQRLLSTISNGRVILSPIGEIILAEWERSPDIRPDFHFDALVIMPDHIHFIIRLNPLVEPHCNASLQQRHPVNAIAHRAPRSVSSFVGLFKGAVTRTIRAQKISAPQSIWQDRFYDRIIRDKEQLQRTRQYIHDNPIQWNSCR